MDAQASLDYITSHTSLSKSPVVRIHPTAFSPHICSQDPQILYGQSIGGAVSIDLASRNPLAVCLTIEHLAYKVIYSTVIQIRALILENTFLSLPRLVPSALPVLGPFSFLCHQKWDSASKIALIPHRTPILMLSGLLDEVVPEEHMQGLWELVKKRGTIPEDKEKEETVTEREPDANELPPPEGKKYTIFEHARTQSTYAEFESGMHSKRVSFNVPENRITTLVCR